MAHPADRPTPPYWQPPQDPTGFGYMPGSGKGAVVLLWILFGFGICASLAIAAIAVLLLSLPQDAKEVMRSAAPWLLPMFAFIIVQTVVWTVLRGVFAVRITRRSASARSGAIVLEAVGIALNVAAWIVLLSAQEGLERGLEEVGAVDTSLTSGGDWIGLILSCIVIGLLRTRETRAWCDR